MSAEKNLVLMAERRDQIREWLEQQEEPTDLDQKHLDSGTPEQAYWHHGYQSALDDVLKMFTA